MHHLRTTSTRSKQLLLSLLALTLTLSVFAVPPADAASSVDINAYYSRINSLRADRGLVPLQIRSDLAASAQSWSDQMARNGALAHDPNLTSAVTNWTSLAENVGWGPTVDMVWTAFTGSPSHIGNLLGNYTHIGVGIAQSSDGALWVTHRFLTQPAPVPAPPPTTTPPVTVPAPVVTVPATSGLPAPSDAAVNSSDPANTGVPLANQSGVSAGTGVNSTTAESSNSGNTALPGSMEAESLATPRMTSNGSRILTPSPADEVRVAGVLDALALLD